MNRAIENDIQQKLTEHLSQTPIPDDLDGKLNKGEIPQIAVAAKRASFHYRPVDPVILNAPSDAVDIHKLLVLMEINPEYICSKFGQSIIKSYRLFLYHPDKDISDNAKDVLGQIAGKLTRKKRDHYPVEFINAQYLSIKLALEKNWIHIKTMHELHQLIYEEFCVDISESHLIEKNKKPFENPQYWARNIIEKMFGLTQETVEKYTKGAKYNKEEMTQYQKNMKSLLNIPD